MKEIKYDELNESQKTFTCITLSLFVGFLLGLLFHWFIVQDLEEAPAEPFPVPGELSDEQELEHAYKLIQTLRATLSAYQNEGGKL